MILAEMNDERLKVRHEAQHMSRSVSATLTVSVGLTLLDDFDTARDSVRALIVARLDCAGPEVSLVALAACALNLAVDLESLCRHVVLLHCLCLLRADDEFAAVGERDHCLTLRLFERARRHPLREVEIVRSVELVTRAERPAANSPGRLAVTHLVLAAVESRLHLFLPFHSVRMTDVGRRVNNYFAEVQEVSTT